MNLDELRSVQSKERQKDSLQNLRPSFYQEVGDYIADLEDERDRAAERADNPFSAPEVGQLTDEIETAKDVVEAIYERRMGKLVKQASLAAAGMAADDEGLTAEEADLFDDLVDRIGSNKTRVLDVLEGAEGGAAGSGTDAATATDTGPTPAGESGDPAGRPGEQSSGRSPADDAPSVPPEDRSTDADPAADVDPGTGDSGGVSPADVMGGEGLGGDGPGEDGPPVDEADRTDGNDAPDPTTARQDQSADGPGSNAGPDSEPTGSAADSGAGGQADDVDRTTVRITSDIGDILGVDDREYTLSSDDVVTLPEQNAAPLVDREAAERLE
ncbi:hypothetical protein CP556_18085 [Natrinema sp. CBA1119]|uniref:DNA replication complex subunit Gins51 n=1 Tax=Natrinema sp. CBA1119 TaxID=1608465 RepID=UPI000BF6C5F2|nr:hypothetical protein [Natrinema sp. CBA1119]PGF17820.1 hypothetical protein CP556_18085 [Natrinema sp. CBA1119]